MPSTAIVQARSISPSTEIAVGTCAKKNSPIQTQTLGEDVHLFDQVLADLSALFQATLVLKKVRHYQDKLLIGGYTNALTDLSPCTILENRENFTLGPAVADWEVILRQDVAS